MSEKEWAFDRYRDGVRMAQGCRVHAPTKDEAIQKARQLFDYEDYTFVEPAEPSEPEAAPASEAQAPAVLDDDHSDQAERDAEELANTYYKPHHFGDGPAWYAACVAACREIIQLRARVAILDAQEVELPELDRIYSDGTMDFYLKKAIYRERQLLDALRAVQAQRTIMCDLRNGLVAARDFIDSGDSGWFPQKWRDAIAAYDALAGKGE